MVDHTLAYLAGLFDGEGCITSYGGKRQDRSSFSAPAVSVQISNSNLDVLILAQNTFGGKIYSKCIKNPKYKPQWTWIVRGKEAERFLSDLLPHLIIKRTQAKIGLTMLVLQGERNTEYYETRKILAKQLSDEKR